MADAEPIDAGRLVALGVDHAQEPEGLFGVGGAAKLVGVEGMGLVANGPYNLPRQFPRYY